MNNFIRALALFAFVFSAPSSQSLAEDKLPKKVAAAFDRVHRSVIAKNPKLLYRLWPTILQAEMMSPGMILILPDGAYVGREALDEPAHNVEELLPKGYKGTRHLFNYRYEFEGGTARVEVHVRYLRRKVILDDFSTQLDP